MRKPTQVKTLHFRVVNITRSRKNGKSGPDNAVKAAAYRSGQNLHDEQADKTYRYAQRGGVLRIGFVAPDNAPDWMKDADQKRLWERFGNEIEKVEDGHNRRASAQLAKDFQIAAPRELSEEQNWALGLALAERFKARGLAAAIAFHESDAADGGRNPHFHVMVSMRTVDEDGFSKRKWRGLNFDNGRDTPELMKLRREYYRLVNDALREVGVEDVYYDPEKQDKEPGKHIGKRGHAGKGEAREKADELRERNREIALQNHVQATLNRSASPEWREKKRQDRRRELQMGRGSAMASRDVSQQALPRVQRGRGIVNAAVDRALHSSAWREREAARDREGKGVKEPQGAKVDAAIEAARQLASWREREAERQRKEKVPEL